MREEVTERRRESYSGGREIEITIGGAVADDDFDRINGDNAPKTPGGIYTRENLKWRREDYIGDTASYTRQLMRDEQESGGADRPAGKSAAGKTKRNKALLSSAAEKIDALLAAVAELAKKARKKPEQSRKNADSKAAAEPQATAGPTVSSVVQMRKTQPAAENAEQAKSQQEMTQPQKTSQSIPQDTVPDKSRNAPQPEMPAESVNTAQEAPSADTAAETDGKAEKDAKKPVSRLIIAITSAVAGVLLLAGALVVVLLSQPQTQPLPVVSSAEIVVVSLSDSVPGFGLEQYNCNFILPEEERIIAIADGLMGNQLYVRHTMAAEQFTMAELDWNIQAKNSPNTFQLYLQALNPVVYLVRASQLTGEAAYLDRAEQFILSWEEYRSNQAQSGGNTMLWNDHGTAMRAESMIYYYLAAQQRGMLRESTAQYIAGTLSRHAEFLWNNDNYTENHNHGIFQDRALIYIACFLNDDNFERWTGRAKTRLQEQTAYAYTSEMIHVENSPHYHNDVTETLRTTARFLMSFGDSVGAELYASLERSAEYLAYIVKPDGHLAEIGDTDSSAESAQKTVAEYWAANRTGTRSYNLLSRIYGEAEYNIAPEAAFYPESGYYVSRGGWSRDGSDKSTWTMFRSGYSSATHKHADDNSFMLYTAGHDVFVDPGYYNYMQGDWHSDYFASAGAHNTVIADGRSWSPTAENSRLTGIYDWYDGENYDRVLGVSEVFGGVSHDRYFYTLGEAVIIYDDIRSDSGHTYSQLFHLGEDTEIVSSSDSEVLIKVGGGDTFVRLRQLGEPCALSVINGADEGAEYGYISRSLNHIDNINTLKFDRTGSDVSFITLITIENSRGKIDGIRSIDYADGVFTVKNSLFSEEWTIELSERSRVDASLVSAVQENDSTFLFVSGNEGEGLEYAWEIISRVDGSVVYSRDYTSEKSFRHEFSGSGGYFVRAYVRDGRLERKAIVAAIDCLGGKCTDVTADYPSPELIFRGHSYADNGGICRFEVDFDYSWDYSIRWYIYRNGVYYDTKTTYTNALDYTFTQPGKYTVLYYLRTAGGNNEMWNFPEITVE